MKLNIEIVNPSQFEEKIALLSTKTKFSVDIETSGLNPYKKDDIIGIGFAWSRYDGIYFPYMEHNLFGTGMSYVYSDKQNDMLKALLENKNIKMSYHNARFDLEFLLVREQIKANYTLDTLALSHLLNENRKSNSLEQLVNARYKDLIGFKTATKNKVKNFSKMPVRDVGERCCKDAIATYRLSEDFIAELKQDKKLFAYYKKFRVALPQLLVEIQVNGFKIDTNRANRLASEYSKELLKMKHELWDVIGYRFNPNSSDDLRKIFYDDLGFKAMDDHRTKKEGKPATDKAAIKALKKQKKHVIFSKLEEYTTKHKLYSTYLIGMPEKAVKGIIHYQLSSTTTKTGRLASKNPNSQNLASDKDIKGLIVARPGYSLIEADYKQLETRLLAFLSNDKVMLEACMASDIYVAMANLITGIPIKNITKDQRDLYKMVTLATMYGMGHDSLSKILGISAKKAKSAQHKFFSTFTSARDWIKSNHEYILKHKQIRSIYGRLRRLPDVDSRDKQLVKAALREGGNFMVQSPAFDYVSMALRRTHKALKNLDANIVLTVHDSIIVEARDSIVPEVVEILKEKMPIPVPPITVKLSIDIDVGKRWGYLKAV